MKVVLLLFLYIYVAYINSCNVDNPPCSTYANCAPFQGCVMFNATCLGGKFAGVYCNSNASCGLEGECIIKGLCYDIPENGIAPCNVQSDCRNGFCVTGQKYGMCASTGKPCTESWQCGGCDICSNGSCLLHYTTTQPPPPTLPPPPTPSLPPTFPPIPSNIPCINSSYDLIYNEEKDNYNEEKDNYNEEKDNYNEEKDNYNEEKDNYNEEKDNNEYIESSDSSSESKVNTSSIIVYSGITSYGTSLVAQDISIYQNNSIQGNVQNGANIYINNTYSNIDFTYAISLYVTLLNTVCDYGPFPAGQDLGGLTLIPGVYCFTSWVQITSDIVFDVVTQQDAQYIFNIPAGLKVADGISMTSVNLPRIPFCNIMWVVGGIVDIGDSVSMGGDILADGNVTIGASELFGRIISVTGGLVMTNSTINSNNCIYGTLSPICTNQPVRINRKEENNE